jgi:hypothetical protein
MLKTIPLLFVTVSCCVLSVHAADAPPTEASIKQLLEVTHAHHMLDDMMSKMNAMMDQMMKQATAGYTVPANVQKQIDQGHAEAMNMMRELLDWNKLEPMYVRVYQKSFTQQEIDTMIAMYKTPGGQAILNKMPVVLENTMAEMQQIMLPALQRFQRIQHDVVAQLQAQKSDNG